MSSICAKLDAIGIARSPYRQRFGIPRQPGLVREAVGSIEMLPPFDRLEMFDGLLDFSHIWVSFVFHVVAEKGWRGRVRPPRLGGNASCGVFASRSPFRPNHLGLSAVELLDIDASSGVCLRVRGLDMVDGTPVVDIKPYLPYADVIPQAQGGYAVDAPEARLEVVFSQAARATMVRLDVPASLPDLVRAALALDPRPAYRHDDDGQRIHGLQLDNFDFRFRVYRGVAEVVEIVARSV